jgi:hypothetical protein
MLRLMEAYKEREEKQNTTTGYEILVKYSGKNKRDIIRN